MNRIQSTLVSSKELIFQLILHCLVFIFYSFDKHNPQITTEQLAFFLNYALAAFVINYLLLPRFFYRKKYMQFGLLLVLVIAGVMFLEEVVLEGIYYPDTRAKSFPGVVYTLVDVTPIIAILVGFKFAWDALGKQKEVERLKMAVKESELQFLQSQINPHFLFNNLNNLYAYAIENSPKTPSIILELSGVLRYMLYECKEKYVLLTKEITQLENFVNLNEMQIEERGQVRFLTDNIRADYQIAPLILIVFIENAFKHSTASQAKDIFIDIMVRLNDRGRLEFDCKNSFQTQSNTEKLSAGIGLKNVKKRLQLLYPNAHQLNIRQGANLYEVRLVINLNKTTQA